MMDSQGYGNVALITGCSSGIGLATTLLFLSHQYQVFGVDIIPFDYKVLDSSSAGGGAYQEHFHFHQGDLTGEGECETVVAICVGAFGPKIHVLANVAGTFDSFASADTVSRSSWDHILATNLTAPVMMMKAVLPFMKAEGKGAIINVGGKASTSGGAAGIAYTASKAGLLGATKNVAWRFRGMGISCNAVLPGGVAATGTSGLQEQEHGDEWDEAAYATVKPFHDLQAGFGGQNDIRGQDVANAILFLASNAASQINGVCLPIDRAWSAL